MNSQQKNFRVFESRWQARLLLCVLTAWCVSVFSVRAEESKYAERREAMVAFTIEERGVLDETVLQAMRKVPRHEFVSEDLRGNAYEDRPLPIGMGQTISQPYIVAYMTELLELEPEAKVLEIGTGSGYQAAVLAEIIEDVYSIEIFEELGRLAGERFQRLKYENVNSRVGDGYHGWEEFAPFDGIIVTCAADHIPPPLIKQLKPGGRMVIPVGGVFQVQRLMLVMKDKEGKVSSKNMLPVRFVPLLGESDLLRKRRTSP